MRRSPRLPLTLTAAPHADEARGEWNASPGLGVSCGRNAGRSGGDLRVCGAAADVGAPGDRRPWRRARGLSGHGRRVRPPHPRRDEARPRQGGGDRRRRPLRSRGQGHPPAAQALRRQVAGGRRHRRPRGGPRHAGRLGLSAAAGAHAAGQAGDPGGEGGRGGDAGGAHRHGAGQGAAYRHHRGVRRRDDLRAVDPAARRHAAGGVRRQLPPRPAGAAGRPLPRRQGHAGGAGRSCAPPPSPTWPPPP